MLREEDIAIELRCQQFHCKCYMRDLNGERSVLLFESKQETNKVSCPHCQSKVYLDGYGSVWAQALPRKAIMPAGSTMSVSESSIFTERNTIYKSNLHLEFKLVLKSRYPKESLCRGLDRV